MNPFVSRWLNSYVLLPRARRSLVLQAPIACLILLVAGCALKESYPSRPITLICPWAAGGGTDRVARQIAASLERELNVPVNVINATGGAGVTGFTRGALARPDGYTMMVMTVELNILRWRGLTNISSEDFDPLMLVNRDDAALFVRDDAPWQSLAELENAIREAPRQLKSSGTAQGGVWHICLGGWLETIGSRPSNVIWISINGSAPSLQELVAGGVEMVCCSLPEAQALLDAERIRCLGLMSPQRHPQYPDVPTFVEQGTDWSIGAWRGLGLPKGVPPERKKILADAVTKVITGKEYLTFMETAGFVPAAEGPEQFVATLVRLDDKFGKMLRSEAFRELETTRFGPMFFPAILGILLIANVGVIVAVGGLRRPAELTPMRRTGFLRVGAVLLWVLLFVSVVESVGFVLTASVLLFAALCWLGNRPPVAALVTLIVVPVSYQLFAVGLRVSLPWGWFGW